MPSSLIPADFSAPGTKLPSNPLENIIKTSDTKDQEKLDLSRELLTPIPLSLSFSSSNNLWIGYRIQKYTFFKPGRVFKILWSEPVGATSDNATEITDIERKYGEQSYVKIRRFVVVRTFSGHSLCLPISTYGGRGLEKRGANTKHHAQVYSSPDRPRLGPEEEAKLMLQPIKILTDSPREKIYPESLLNYAKVYTIEHNVKVCPVGRVAKESQRDFYMDFETIGRYE